MKKVTILTIAMLMIAGAIQAQDETRIPPGSKIYVNDMGGFETYFIAALRKKEVPLVVVANREQADFEVKGSAETEKAGWAGKIFQSGRSTETASVQVINIKTGVVAYAAASDKKQAWHGKKSTAEAVAKSIRAKIEDDQKRAAKK